MARISWRRPHWKDKVREQTMAPHANAAIPTGTVKTVVGGPIIVLSDKPSDTAPAATRPKKPVIRSFAVARLAISHQSSVKMENANGPKAADIQRFAGPSVMSLGSIRVTTIPKRKTIGNQIRRGR